MGSAVAGVGRAAPRLRSEGSRTLRRWQRGSHCGAAGGGGRRAPPHAHARLSGCGAHVPHALTRCTPLIRVTDSGMTVVACLRDVC